MKASNPCIKSSDGVSFEEMNKALREKNPRLRLERRPKKLSYFNFLRWTPGCFLGKCNYGGHSHYVGYDSYRGLFLDRGHTLVQVEPSDYVDKVAAQKFFEEMGASALMDVRELVELPGTGSD